MSLLDWAVLAGSLAFIVAWGTLKNRHQKDLDSYLVAGRSTPWHTVAISIMATQASAITFLSTPGQAYADGMRFLQFYLGLPIAMVVLSVTAVPIYHRLKVYTAYEYLERRFDLKTRTLATFLFLLQRGLSTGVSIYATAIVLSVILGWNITAMNVVMGGLVVVYTASGGARAVNWTQTQQFLICILGMAAAFGVVVYSLPAGVSLVDGARVAGALGRMNAIDFSFDPKSRYNFWSGLIGGFFLALSYFGTDQSQVGRYLGGRSVAQTRMGLLFNGLVKVPMQFFILFLGAMVFVFYQFVAPPVFFNRVELQRARAAGKGPELAALEARHQAAFEARRTAVSRLLSAAHDGDAPAERKARAEVTAAQKSFTAVRGEAVSLLSAAVPDADTNDTNYIFLSFVMKYLPAGLVGLLVAVVFAAAMSSNSAAMCALAGTSVVDVYVRLIRKGHPDSHYVRVSRYATVLWGLVAVLCAQYASRLGTLIEAVNILGSLFYGTILGIFLLAFYFPKVNGTAAFAGALVGEAAVVACFTLTKLSFLWYNVVGCLVAIGVALLIRPFVGGMARVAAVTEA